MALEDKNKLVKDLNAIGDQDEKFRYIIQYGKSLPVYPDEFRNEDFLIKGCVSQLWLHPEFKNDKLYFMVDSDATIPKGIAAILASVFSGLTPDEVIAFDTSFLSDVGVEQHLSMNRRNGLASLHKQIKMYGIAFKAMQK